MLLLTVMGSLSVTLSAQDYDDDDIYFNPSKSKATQKTVKKSAKSYNYTTADYPAADTYSTLPGQGRTEIDVDTYNRRGIFAADTARRDSSDASGFAYTRQIEKYYNPEVVTGSSDKELAQYYYNEQPANINITVVNPGYWGYNYIDPWYATYTPYWGWGSWNWAWNWGWGPSWSLAWGPTWGWGWGPSWSWGWSYPGWGWGGHHWAGGWGHRPNRPIGNVRPGYRGNYSSAIGNNRGGYRGGYGTNRAAYGNSRGTYNNNGGYRSGSSRSGYRSGSSSRSNNSYRSSGSSRSSNSQWSTPSSRSNNSGSYRSSGGGSYRSSGGSYGGGSRGGGGGRGRH